MLIIVVAGSCWFYYGKKISLYRNLNVNKFEVIIHKIVVFLLSFGVMYSVLKNIGSLPAPRWIYM